MDPLCTTTSDVFCPYPVVLIAIEDITDLVRPDGVHVFIVAAHLLPLWKGTEKQQINIFLVVKLDCSTKLVENK